MTENQASEIITRFFINFLEKKRLQSAKSAYTTMRSGKYFQDDRKKIHRYSDPLWADSISDFVKKYQKDAERIKHYEQLDFQMISRYNFADSFMKTKQLSKGEKSFLDFFMRQDFYLVHATKIRIEDSHENICLKSRTRLLKDNVKYLSNSESDIDSLKNEDYVFFSLEAGEPIWKSCSRFGNLYYKIKFNHESLKYASMTLLDQLLMEWVNVHIEGISSNGKQILQSGRQSLSIFDVMFHGRDASIYGLAYNIISASRLLSDEDRTLILTTSDTQQLNNIINSFFRPEIRVSGAVNISRGKYTTGEFSKKYRY
ncbi:hypothetical protein KGP17_23030 [Serratia sp. JSRIV001]|uniref:hypothetical protein n=1 Tax=unclassified Serratia (in: enterobacteria) TaxID=2647522 RepID=UPI001CC04219|nr:MULTISPECIES: hypothetical protein [unclassified Serratia (in: enterobacteria)]UAN45227.1 hypothetical protein KGP17_23030 [Serratia sp. JSRIV001]UAN50701.1 hypothetical protein KGP26_23860 [Serratia sp. JSRIV002]UAN56666.1 hypothetical protein KGP21_24090 [Serratia sp. JSRIV004]